MSDLRIINIVDSLSPINFGIWGAALSTSENLAKMGVNSEIWFPQHDKNSLEFKATYVPLKSLDLRSADLMMTLRQLNPSTDIIVSHGSWRFPSLWGNHYKHKGFKWIYTSQGMLEPWSRKQKKLVKSIYFKLFERRYLRRADRLRAVSETEMINLKSEFPNASVVLIPNGVGIRKTPEKEPGGTMNFLFLGRLHKKKGIVPLVEGWIRSGLNNNDAYKLFIAGPDQGELPKILALMESSTNISYVGYISGDAKENLYIKSHFFVLPTLSEGFPSSVLEAMQYGLIPLISREANFPAVFDEHIGFELHSDKDNICSVLEQVSGSSQSQLRFLSSACKKFIETRYSLDIIAEKQLELYLELLHEK